VTEDVQYLHYNGVIYSDLRPKNCLVHASTTASLDILLCDFDGSICQDLGLNGRGLPDPPFWDIMWESTLGTDIFNLRSTFYTIITGHWPYKSAHPFEEKEDRWDYEDRVITLLKQTIYPDIEGIIGGTIIIDY
jgi:serine/threonine protein kinase